MDVKQVIIVRKDLGMSTGKVSAQVSHGAMFFLRNRIIYGLCRGEVEKSSTMQCQISIEPEEYAWLSGEYKKTVLGAKNKGQLMKAVVLAEEIGLKEGVDFFIVKDNCHTELVAEEEDGTTITCLAFRPMLAFEVDKIGRKYQLLK